MLQEVSTAPAVGLLTDQEKELVADILNRQALTRNDMESWQLRDIAHRLVYGE